MGANSGREVNHWSRLLVNFLLPCLFQKKRLPPSWLAEWYILHFLKPVQFFFFFFNFQLKFPVVYLNQSHDNPHQHGRFQCYYSLFPLWALVTSWCILLHLPTFFSLVVIPCFLNMLPPPPQLLFWNLHRILCWEFHEYEGKGVSLNTILAHSGQGDMSRVSCGKGTQCLL